MGGQKSFSKRLFSSRIFLILVLILSLVFLIGFAKAFWRDYLIRREINALLQEKEKWEKNKIELLNRLQEIKSPAFAEQEARLKFGLGQAGESLAIIAEPASSVATSPAKTMGEARRPVSNPAGWWQYFFK